MLNGLYSTASALNISFHKQDIVAHNLAHVNVPGFKKVLATIGAMQSGGEESKIQVVNADGTISLHNVNGAVLRHRLHDFTQGRIEETGIPLNVAINGEGFFSVEQNGETLYTRNGDFKIDPDGQLVLSSGQAVLGEGGPITIPPDARIEDLRIDPTGQISLGTQSLGKLQVIGFENPQLLEAVGTTLFRAPANAANAEVTPDIQQYYLESSNAQAVSELVQMISGMRHFEAAQKALTSISEAIQRHALDGNN